MDFIALILARGGSKGLPGKNVRPLKGKPLIGWAIEHAKAVQRIRRVIVSTDSPIIAEVAREFGAETPFLRPAELATDHSPEWAAWKHALSYIKKDEGKLPQAIICVPVTAPLRLPVDIENCLDLYEQGGADIIVTVSDAHRNPYFNMVKKTQGDLVELAIAENSNIGRRQDAPVVYDMTTVAYVADPVFVMSHHGIFEGRVKAVNVPIERAIDIDTLLDFEIAEFLLTKKRVKI